MSTTCPAGGLKTTLELFQKKPKAVGEMLDLSTWPYYSCLINKIKKKINSSARLIKGDQCVIIYYTLILIYSLFDEENMRGGGISFSCVIFLG